MPEAIDVTCPCCEAVLKVDPETGAVVWVDGGRKKEPARDFDELVDKVRASRSSLDEKFERAARMNASAKDVLAKKFEEARKRAALDPDAKPPNPFDWD
jgi:hypothetical protein